MSASKGVHLWLRPAAKDRKATWIIRDGERQKSTGCGTRELERANELLADYIVAQRKPADSRGLPTSQVPVADVILHYQQTVTDKTARPKAAKDRLKQLVLFFGHDTLADVNKNRTRAYTAHREAEVARANARRRVAAIAAGRKPSLAKRSGTTAARRELEDLRAAINKFFEEEAVPPVVNIELPAKPAARERWLTETQAATLLKAAWRKTQPMPKGGRRRVGQHIARFILLGLFTGSRSAAICDAAIRPTEGRGYVDLENGVFYRRPPGSKESSKRRPPARLPEKLLAHLRRWERLGLCQHSVIEWEGQPVKRISKAFKRLVDELGFTGVTPHTLRHTGITWALQRGAKWYDVSDYFGVSQKVIREVYAHHDPEHHREVTQRMERRRRPDKRPSPVPKPVPLAQMEDLSTT